MKTAQRRMPNKSFNADIRYSEIMEISLKQEEMEREKQFISVFLVRFLAYAHDVEAYQQLVLDARKPVFGVLRTTKVQTSLRICAV